MINVTDDLNKVDGFLDKLEEVWGLSQSYNSKIHCAAFEILNTDYSDIKLTPEDYLNNSIILSQYAFQLQRIINREEARVHYIKNRIDKIVLPNINQQNAYYYNDKRNLAIAQDSVAQALLKEQTVIELKVKRLQFLSTRVENLSNKFMEYSRATRKTEKNYQHSYEN